MALTVYRDGTDSVQKGHRAQRETDRVQRGVQSGYWQCTERAQREQREDPERALTVYREGTERPRYRTQKGHSQCTERALTVYRKGAQRANQGHPEGTDSVQRGLRANAEKALTVYSNSTGRAKKGHRTQKGHSQSTERTLTVQREHREATDKALTVYREDKEGTKSRHRKGPDILQKGCTSSEERPQKVH